MTMKNITVSVDEKTHRQARIRAAELDTSVSALVRAYLRDLCAQPAPPSPEQSNEELSRVIEEIKVKHPDFRASDRLPREELYERAGTGA